jgi:6-phosphogluconolactonase
MRNMRVSLALILFAGAALAVAPNYAAAQNDQGAVFVMTNAATNNQIKSYVRREDGTLQSSGTFSTGGNGSGGTVDPLTSQGSLTLNVDHSLLFAVNAGSGTVSSFAVNGPNLSLLDTEPSGGGFPTSVTQVGNLLYVLNAGGNGSVSGFHLLPNGHLLPIPHSTRPLGDSPSAPTDVVLSPNAQFLVVIESATNKIAVFHVFPNGTLSNPVVTDSAGTVPFAAVFAPNGALIVGNVENNKTVSSTISSYQLNGNGSLRTISNALPTGGSATCWDVIGRSGRSVYTSNPNNSTLSGFNIERNGELTPIGGAVVGQTPTGSLNIDIAASDDGRYLYTVDTIAGAISIFAVQDDGGLVSLGQQDGLPASAGLNGIAAY